MVQSLTHKYLVNLAIDLAHSCLSLPISFFFSVVVHSVGDQLHVNTIRKYTCFKRLIWDDKNNTL